VDLYILVLEGLVRGDIDNGRDGGWYFGSNDEHTWYGIAGMLADVLYELGVIKSREVSQFEDDFLEKNLGKMSIAFLDDSRCIPNRSKKIGWKPKDFPTVYDSLREEMKYLLDQGIIKAL